MCMYVHTKYHIFFGVATWPRKSDCIVPRQTYYILVPRDELVNDVAQLDHVVQPVLSLALIVP